jgi:release factor glutamine methyltransferase
MELPSAKSKTVGDLLAGATEVLERSAVPEARANAELLLAQLLDTDRGWLFVHRAEILDEAAARRYESWVRRRASREPLKHVTGVQEFHGLSLRADRRALIPRPETEGLVDATLSLDLPVGARVADLGAGGGCISVALAVRRGDLEIDALERSGAALDLARENAELHGVTARIRFTEGDLGDPPAAWRGRMHCVVSNPPYGSESEWPLLQPEVRDHDPREAFVAGPTGLEAYQALARPVYALLRPSAHLVLELGFGQAADVSAIVTGAGFEVREIRPDFNGIERVLLAQKGGG